MRVKIAYTVDLQEVPEKVKEFLDASVHTLATTSSDLMDVSVAEHIDITLAKIDSIRQRLALVDDRLEDCYHALAGYNHARMETHSPTEHMPSSAVMSDEPITASDMERLTQQMNDLRTSADILEQEIGGTNE